jgi:hypothetical protein
MRFSIRDLLWATLVVAMGLAWWNEHRAHSETDAKRQAAVRQAYLARDALGESKELLEELWNQIANWWETGERPNKIVKRERVNWALLDEPFDQPFDESVDEP